MCLGLAACGQAPTVAERETDLPPVEDNRFFANVEDLEFVQDRGSNLPLPGPSIRINAAETIPIDTRPGFPTIEYNRACGAEDIVQVFTTVSLDLEDPSRQLTLPNFTESPERWRGFGFEPGIVSNQTEYANGDPENQYTVTDIVSGVDNDDPNIFSYQWLHTNRAPTLATGAWVATRFEAEPDVIVEVFVVSSATQFDPPSEEFRGVPFVYGDALLAEMQNPLFSERFDCVSQTFQDITPVIEQYKALRSN